MIERVASTFNSTRKPMRRLTAFFGILIVFGFGAAAGAAPAGPRAADCPPPPPPTPYSLPSNPVATPPGHPLNNVTVENCHGGTIEARSKIQVVSVADSRADPVNFAYAFAHDCSTGCAAIAAAFQVALIARGTHSESPQNYAVALNLRCDHCGVFAFAYQYAVQVPKGTKLRGATRARIARIRRLADHDVHAGITFAKLDGRLHGLATQLRSAVDDGLRSQRVAERHKRSSQHVQQSGKR